MRKKNSYFQFKQFRIEQDNCAMKVSTDACIFGAISVQLLSGVKEASLLDIGAGTGILSLMWAQKHSDIAIDAVEIDRNASTDCQINFNKSPFKKRMRLINIPLQDFHEERKYDIIISNPPFFRQSLKNESVARSVARHADISLSPDDLFSHSYRLSHDDTVLITLYPHKLSEHILRSAHDNNFLLVQKIDIRSYPDAPPHCSIFLWKKHNEPLRQSSFSIYAERGIYTEEFKILLRDFYLNF